MMPRPNISVNRSAQVCSERFPDLAYRADLALKNLRHVQAHLMSQPWDDV